MKKTNFTLVVSSIVFLLFLGVSASAQSTFGNPYPLDEKELDVSDVVFVDVTDALIILENQTKLMEGQDQSGMTLSQEAENSVKIAYYNLLIQQIGSTGSITDVLPNSAQDLLMIIGRFNLNLGVSPEAIYDEVVDLLD